MSAGARVGGFFGPVKNFLWKVDEDTLHELDTTFLGTMSMLWSLIKSRMPAELMDPAIEKLEREELPNIYSYVLFLYRSKNALLISCV